MTQGRRSALVVAFTVACAVAYAAHCYTGQPEDPAAAVAARMAALASWKLIYVDDGDNFQLKQPQLDGGTRGSTRADVETISRNMLGNSSAVDAVFLCLGAKVTSWPISPDAGTQRGSISTSAQKALWGGVIASEPMRFATQMWFQNAGRDPYADQIRDIHEWGRPAFVSYRVNDNTHAFEFLRPQFWYDNPSCRIVTEGLDFNCSTVVDYNVGIIERTLARYEVDGLELDFNRSPPFSSAGAQATKISQLTGFVTRVRAAVDTASMGWGRTMKLGVKIPATSTSLTAPASTPTQAKAFGVDAKAWYDAGLIDFITVSAFFTQELPLGYSTWRTEMGPNIPIFGGVEYHGDAGAYLVDGTAVKTEGFGGCSVMNFHSDPFIAPYTASVPWNVLQTLCQ